MRTLKTVAWTLLALAGLAGIVSFAAPSGDAVPVGTVMAWAGEKDSVPTDWMICDGKALKTAQYKELFAAIGWSWGKPAAKRFNLPDLRGRFMRGVDDGSGLDPDAADREQSAKGGNSKGVGSVQDDAVQEHTHYQLAHSHQYRFFPQSINVDLGNDGYMARYGDSSMWETESVQPTISGVVKYKNHANARNAEETRPKNAGVYFIIKVR